ncbi:ankyrin [Jackrogersella minutella]|nr:ankyrin [Jackrogersella minutella]
MLPAGVVVRTPSPVGHFAPPFPVLQGHPPVHYPKPPGPPYTTLAFSLPPGPLIHSSQHMNQFSSSDPHFWTSVRMLNQEAMAADPLKLALERYVGALRNIPWVKFKDEIISAIYQSNLGSLSDILGVELSLNSSKALGSTSTSTTFSFLQELGQIPASSVPTLNFDPYHLLTEAIYLISNGLVDVPYFGPCPEIVQLLLDRIPKSILLGLFQSDLHTIWVMWVFLADCAGKYGYKGPFALLMGVGLRHLKWVLPKGASYLAYAASMGALDIIRALLKAGIRADHSLTILDRGITAIIEATATGNLECVELLLGVCNVNLAIYINFDLEYGLQKQVLDMFLERGAIVDSVWEIYSDHDLLEFYEKAEIPSEWFPTLLEMSYYWNIRLFEKLVPYRNQAFGRITRPDICLSVKQGKEVLHEYLISQPSESGFDTTSFLELVLAEQFVVENLNIDFEVVQGLLQYGVDPNVTSLALDANFIVHQLVRKAHAYDSQKYFGTILKLLLQSGAAVDSKALEAAIGDEEEGIDILEILSQHGTEISKHGAVALSTAARRNNYKAVSYLLEAGVDINVEACYASTKGRYGLIGCEYNSTGVADDVTRWSVIGLASVGYVQSPSRVKLPIQEQSKPASCKMLGYLIDRGAVLKNGPQDPNAFDFLYRLISTSGNDDHLFERVSFLLKSNLGHRDLSSPRGCLLEACVNPNHIIKIYDEIKERFDTFTLLLRHGVPIRDSRVLPSLIYHGGPDELIQEVIEAGVDLNAYSSLNQFNQSHHQCIPLQAAASRGDRALVEQLLRWGANINGQCVIAPFAKTPLQAACGWEPDRRVDKINLVHFMIENGAEINAPAGAHGGCTALQVTAMVGDIETALLLIYHGADPNAPPAEEHGMCALEQAVCFERLDMVKLLLNVGALSHTRGQTGYDGAIELAERNRQFAIADLIRQHADNEMGIFGFNRAMTFFDKTAGAETQIEELWRIPMHITGKPKPNLTRCIFSSSLPIALEG